MLSARYAITCVVSLALWVVPINVKAPKAVIFFCFIGSCGGFLYAYTLADPLEKQIWYRKQEEVQEREVLIHDFALREYVLKQGLDAEYLGPAQLEKEPVAVEETQQELKGTPQLKMLPDALPEHLKTIIQLAQEEGGKITQRVLMRKKQFKDKVKAEEMQQYLRELQKRGYGEITSDGRTFTFHLTRVAA